jgi:membrane associated rhomboid family serine protease
MGIYDRGYYRENLPRGGFGHFSAWSITTWLIIINVLIFFLDGLLKRTSSGGVDPSLFDDGTPEGMRQYVQAYLLANMGPLEYWGYFSAAKAVFGLQVWRFITFQFLHASIGHLLGNMIGLFFFGPIVEAQFGSRRFLAFYLMCGLAGAALYLLLSASHVLVSSPQTPMVGASAGIFGLLVAAALIAPHVEIFYYLFPVTIGMLAVVGMLMAGYAVIASGPNAGGEAGHLGGGILGLALMKNQHWLNFATGGRSRASAAARPRRRRRAFQKDWSKDLNR